MRRVGFNDWVQRHEARAKQLDIRLTRKHYAKLRSAYIDWCVREYGPDLNTLIAAVYSDTVEVMVYAQNPLLERIKKSRGGSLFEPVPRYIPTALRDPEPPSVLKRFWAWVRQ